MDLIDFGWLWRNDELSDFQLVIRPCLKRPSAHGVPLPETQPGEGAHCSMMTRSRKRRCAAEPGQDQAAEAAAAPDQAAQPGTSDVVLPSQTAFGSGRVTTRSRAAKRAADQRPGQTSQQLQNQHQGPQQRRKRRSTDTSNAQQVAPDQQQQQQQQHAAGQPGPSTAAAPPNPPPPPRNLRRTTRRGAAAAAAAAGGGASGSRAAGPSETAAAGVAAAAACGGPGPSTAGGSGSVRPADIIIPVHAAVLTGTSEYFKLLIRGWSSQLNRMLTLEVGEDEGPAAELMIEFMYTGKLPREFPPEELLRMIRLADQYQVTRFLTACNTSFDQLPLACLDMGVVLGVFELPQLMLDSPALRNVLVKVREKVQDVFGDLEKVWQNESSRDEFLRLPLGAVQCLLSNEATSVHHENTALVALTGWLDLSAAGRATTLAQKKELLGLIRLPYLTSSFLGDVLAMLPWARELLDTRQLFNALQFAVASETTRLRLALCEGGAAAAATPHFRSPRPASSINKLTFEWSIELSQIKRMVGDARLWNRVVELHSPLHYFGGFYWQLLFNVEKTPSPADAGAEAAAAGGGRGAAGADGGAVMEFVGVRCHANLGRCDFWPRVVRFKANISALQTGLWDMEYVYSKGLEGPIVDGVGLGYPGFFALAGQNLDSDAAWSRFVRNNKISLRAEILECE